MVPASFPLYRGDATHSRLQRATGGSESKLDFQSSSAFQIWVFVFYVCIEVKKTTTYYYEIMSPSIKLFLFKSKSLVPFDFLSFGLVFGPNRTF